MPTGVSRQNCLPRGIVRSVAGSSARTYCDRAAAALGDLIAYACTINEPEGLGEGGFVLGVNPPGRKGDIDAMWRVAANMLEAHRRGAAAIRTEAHVPTGVTLALPDLQYEDGATMGDAPVEL